MAVSTPDTLVGLTAALAAVTFMFQSRHHNLYGHEQDLIDRVDELQKALALAQKDGEPCLNNKLDNKLENQLNELRWVRRRYEFALIAFVLIMAQVFVLLFALTHAALGEPDLKSMGLEILFWIWVPAFGFHIIGDLGLAFYNQLVIRRQLRVRQVSKATLIS